MVSYRVIVSKEALKEIESLGQRADRSRIMARIRKLADNPRPQGSTKLKGPFERYRLRQGDYRILYEIRDEILIVTIVHVGHRKDIYRGHA